MIAKIGIAENNLQAVASELSKILADEYVLYTKTRNAHWNVAGPDFFDKHKFFEAHYEQLDEIIDNVAERIRALGHYTPATLRAFLSLTSLLEATDTTNNSNDLMVELLSDHETIILKLRANINRFANDFGDIGSSDFITGLLQEHEKMAWLLRAHIK